MRSAISPRLAISSFWIFMGEAASADDDQRLIELDRLTVADEDFPDYARGRRGDLVHNLHRLDDQQRITGFHRVTDRDERFRARLGRQEGGADHWRFHGFTSDFFHRRRGGRLSRGWCGSRGSGSEGRRGGWRGGASA